MEDLRVRRPRYLPGGLSSGGGGGGGRLAMQLGVELAAELGRAASSVEDGLLLVLGVLGGDVRRGLLRVVRIPREACAAVSSPGNRARAISMILAQVSGWSIIAVCPEHHRRRLYKGSGGREMKGQCAGTAFSSRAGSGIGATTWETAGGKPAWRDVAVLILPPPLTVA
jgi:hypothetical protein